MTANPGIAASGESERPAELPALTALRGLAALTVVLFHSSSLALAHAGGVQAGGPLIWIWARGYLAVDLFFFLSGFVLTHVYGSHLARERSWRLVGRFFWARFCRIYPASIFVAAIFVLQFTTARLVFPADFSIKTQLLASLTLMQVPWLDTVVINNPSWSISAEFYAYLLFPFIIPIIYRLRRYAVVTLGVAVLTAIIAGGRSFSHLNQTAGWVALFRALPEFTAGILCYRSYSERLFQKFWEKDATLVGIVVLIIGAFSAGVSDGLILMLLLALLLASVCNSGQASRILDAGPLRWLGEVSYSVYIFQMLPLMLMVSLSGLLVTHSLGGAWFAALGASLALGGGVLVHRCVDVPVRRALRRLPNRVTAFSAGRRAAQIGPISPLPVAAPGRGPMSIGCRIAHD